VAVCFSLRAIYWRHAGVPEPPPYPPPASRGGTRIRRTQKEPRRNASALPTHSPNDLLLAKRKAHGLQEDSRFLVRLRGRADDDVHASDPVERVVRDLGEDELLFQTESVVAASVEGLRRQTLEVSDPRKDDRGELVEEVIHAVTAERDLGANLHSLAELKVRDRFLGDRHDRLLAADELHVSDR